MRIRIVSATKFLQDNECDIEIKSSKFRYEKMLKAINMINSMLNSMLNYESILFLYFEKY